MMQFEGVAESARLLAIRLAAVRRSGADVTEEVEAT